MVRKKTEVTGLCFTNQLLFREIKKDSKWLKLFRCIEALLKSNSIMTFWFLG